MIFKIIHLLSLIFLITACTEEVEQSNTTKSEKDIANALPNKPMPPKIIKSPVMRETKFYQPEVDEQGYIQLTEDKALIDQEIGLLEKSRIETESKINQLVHQLNDHLDNSKEREKIQQELNQLTQSYKQNVLALAKHQIRLQFP
ncbi:MAG: hypothetical protein KAG10_00815 [Methylococcales bacterium]|nr:hypothetical protein [Methylococcales bacterium]